MARQRNNIAGMPWELRRIVCEGLLDGKTYDEIRAAVLAADPAAPTLHCSSFGAYSESAEYRQFCDQKREWDERTQRRRWAAAFINEGEGPRSLADVAEFEVLEQLAELAGSGAAMESGDIVKVARAISYMQRTQLARTAEERKNEIAAIEAEHEAQVAEFERRIAELEGRLEERDGSRSVDLSRVADEMDRILG